MFSSLIRICLISTTLLCLGSGVALAQDDVGGGEAAGGSIGGSTSTSTTTTSGIAITVGPLITTSTVAGAAGKSASIESYLRQNAVAVQTDFRLGAGDTVNDLAHFFTITAGNQKAFGQIIRTHHKTLLELARTKTINKTKTKTFINTIYAAMKQDVRFQVELKQLGTNS